MTEHPAPPRNARAERALWTVMFVVAFGTNVPTPLLLIYRDSLGLSPSALTGAFGVYAAGLVPALLLAGPASDRFGRRPVVGPFVVLSVVTSVLLIGAGSSVALLFTGRFLQGAVSGVVFSVGTAWLGELVREPGRSARLATAALGAGWALGPLSSGLLAQGLLLLTRPPPALAPTVLPYLVHVALMVVGLVLLVRIPETLPPARRAAAGRLLNLGVPPGARWPFVLVVLPIALGVFTLPSTAVTVLPLLLIPSMPGIAVAVTGMVAGVTLLTGALAPPLERRLGALWAGPVGLGLGAVGLALSLVGAAFDAWLVLVPVAVLLGAGYGLCLAAGLTIVARLAPPTERGALTGTFYACAYLGFGVPLVLALAGGGNGFGTPLLVLTVLSAVLAAALALPVARRLLVTSMSSRRTAAAQREEGH